jgi:hypothetical protein
LRKFLLKKWNKPIEGETNETLSQVVFPTSRRKELNDITQDERSEIVEILIDGNDNEILSLVSKYGK